MPTLDVIEGYEHQVLSGNRFGGSQIDGLWNDLLGGTFSIVAGRNGQALNMIMVNGTLSAARKGVPLSQHRVFSLYFKVASAPSVTSPWFGVSRDDDSSQFAMFYVNTSGQLQARITAGGPLQTYSPSIADNVYHRLDAHVDSSGTTWTLSWSVDGVAQTDSTEGGHSASDSGRCRVGAQDGSTTGTLTIIVDDLVMSATAGDYPIGPHSVYALLPNADGTHNAGTNTIEDNAGTDIVSPNAFPLMDEWAPNTTDYVQQSAIGTGNYAEVGFQDSSDATVWGVEAIAALFSAGTNANSATTRIVDSTNATLVDVYAGDMSETSLHYRRAIVPAPGGTWDAGELSGVKARVGFASDVIDVPRWSALMLQYAVPAATTRRPMNHYNQSQAVQRSTRW